MTLSVATVILSFFGNVVVCLGSSPVVPSSFFVVVVPFVAWMGVVVTPNPPVREVLFDSAVGVLVAAPPVGV